MDRYAPWFFAVFLLAGGVLPESWVGLLEFNRQAIAQGDSWRLLTGHWVHFGLSHSLMNAAGYALVQYQFYHGGVPRRWWILQLMLCLSVSALLLVFSPDVEIYRGYSGVFCGFLAFSLAVSLRQSPWVFGVLLLGLLVKIALEQLPHYNVNYLMPFIGVAVAVDAHAYGTAAGLAATPVYLAWRIWYRRRQSQR
jgi:rhomboid family GlyGly-CTERM serine protease